MSVEKHAITVAHRTGKLKPHPSISHPSHVIGYIVSGSFCLEYQSMTHSVEGCMLVAPAGIPHRAISGQGDWWFAEFCAPCHGLDESHPLMLAYDRVRRGAAPILLIDALRRDRVNQLFTDLQEECGRLTPDSLELSRSILKLLLGEANRALVQAKIPKLSEASTSKELVAEALQYIQRNALTAISLSDVAEAVHRSPAHLAATVKAETGHTVGDWIRSARIAEASSLLLHSNASLQEIAERVGWQDKNHFIRQFRKIQGQTPAAWRRRMR